MSEVSFTPEQVRARYAKIIPTTLVAAAVVLLVVAWGLYVAKTSFGVNVVGMSASRAKELRSTGPNNFVELAFAVIATAVAPYLLWKAVVLRRLALNGQETVGRIVGASMVSKAGSTPVRIEYAVAGNVYRTKKDYPSDEAVEGRQVRVIYDPNKPSRSFVI